MLAAMECFGVLDWRGSDLGFHLVRTVHRNLVCKVFFVPERVYDDGTSFDGLLSYLPYENDSTMLVSDGSH